MRNEGTKQGSDSLPTLLNPILICSVLIAKKEITRYAQQSGSSPKSRKQCENPFLYGWLPYILYLPYLTTTTSTNHARQICHNNHSKSETKRLVILLVKAKFQAEPGKSYTHSLVVRSHEMKSVCYSHASGFRFHGAV